MKPTIPFEIFSQVEMRVGLVVSATQPEWSQKLLELHVDFGAEIGTKTILTGVKAWYAPEDFVGHAYVFVVNLAERKMGEGVSQGMMIMTDGEKPLPLIPTADVNPGTLIR